MLRGFCITALFLTILSEAQAGICEPKKETIKKDDDITVEMIRYLCSAEPGKPTLRVSFYELDEALAGSVVSNIAFPELQSAIGPFEALENEVSATVKALFEGFGAQTDYDFAMSNVHWAVSLNDFTLVQKADDADVGTAKRRKQPPRQKDVRRIPYLSSDHFSLTEKAIVLKDVANTVLNTTRWPTGYKFIYTCGEFTPNFLIACTTIWRHITQSDFDLLLQDMREFVRNSGTRRSAARPASTIVPDYERHFKLYAHLAQQGMPADFLSIFTNLESGCGGDGWDFRYSGRPLKVRFALVENMTDQPIRIDSFRGMASGAKGLRPDNESVARSTDGAGALNLQPRVLAAKAKLALPLRTAFGSPARKSWDFDSAKQTYEAIKKGKTTVFEQKVELSRRKSYVVRKSRESFGEPEFPADIEYLFGPELSLAGLVAGGVEYVLPKGEPARSKPAKDADPEPSGIGDLSLSVQVALPVSSSGNPEEGASCPILYFWNAETSSWVTLGKVLHDAKDAENEMTQTIRLPYLETRFRLAEEEPEVSYIKDATLKLTLKDDRQLELRPRQAYSRIIPAYTAIEIDFDLPTSLSRDDVVSSELSLTGYYERYNPAVTLVRGGSRSGTGRINTRTAN